MLGFFRRKKPETPPAVPATDAPPAAGATGGPDAPAPDASVHDVSVQHAPAPQADAAVAAPASAPDEPLPAEIIAAAMDVDARAAVEPVVSEPAVPEPAVSEPAVPEPAVSEPAMAEPGPGAFAEPASAPAGEAAAPGKKGWRDRLRGSAFARTLGGLFSRNPRLDDDLLDEIETALITADVGVTATTQLIQDLRKRMKAREFADAGGLLRALRQDLLAILAPVAVPLEIDPKAGPFVLLTVGVNGVGKTTTIGKLAKRFKDEGRPLMLAAGDTFRAAAVAQLQAWGERNGVPVVAQGQNADAASVAFDALQAAKARGTQVLIADTAGRLHTQQGLMAELGKIKRVLQKLDPGAPHEVLMVIDGTTGQNALSQLRQFHAAVGVTGLVVTKLDGTAKGGVVFALAREFGIPIRYAGIGERPEDLRVFDAQSFVDALLPESLGN
ncbi:signal recognition particle-docking protein FtsY [Agrilutibacter solisilvae]|uniref:Signal recognition particle receptor FtsY n=1 Tax=Agrilutibacter solisilvae TaxID=2763317 RepID=A0A974XYC3_9GAMM|nr:signal recognition particle-docking protein FtsY [Lysobacter solisilvae]QSX77178.1 signal recognition particle-docking protein FtsY [Lysobacter solisilvae]